MEKMTQADTALNPTMKARLIGQRSWTPGMKSTPSRSNSNPSRLPLQRWPAAAVEAGAVGWSHEAGCGVPSELFLLLDLGDKGINA